eukprot:m.85534 g.85534  ORF g.85534 m.85534 type:complete len:145 (-) comp50878_c0_seq15:39-473(-)
MRHAMTQAVSWLIWINRHILVEGQIKLRPLDAAFTPRRSLCAIIRLVLPRGLGARFELRVKPPDLFIHAFVALCGQGDFLVCEIKEAPEPSLKFDEVLGSLLLGKFPEPLQKIGAVVVPGGFARSQGVIELAHEDHVPPDVGAV